MKHVFIFLFVLSIIQLPGESFGIDTSTEQIKTLRGWLKSYESARIKLISRLAPTVVAIYGKENAKQAGGGSGVLIHPHGYALTNYHVVAALGPPIPSENVVGVAGLADGKRYPWRLIGIDPGGDLAMIQLLSHASQGISAENSEFPYAPIGNSDIVEVGDFVLAMGNPFLLTEDESPTVTMGIVSGVRRYQEGTGPAKNLLEYGECLQIDSSINPGNSGGPLFNFHGELIGINGRGSFEERGRVNVGVGYAISMKQCVRFIPELLAGKVTLHGRLPAVFESRGNRVICTAIENDTELYHAGLRLGDRLKSFDHEPVLSANFIKSRLATYPSNWPISFRVYDRIDATQDKQFLTRLLPLKLPSTDMGVQRPKPKGKQPIPGMPAPKNHKLSAADNKPGEVFNKARNQYESKRIIKEALANLHQIEMSSLESIFDLISAADQIPQNEIDWLNDLGELLRDIYANQPDISYETALLGAEPVIREDVDRVCYKIKISAPHVTGFLWISVLDANRRSLHPTILKIASTSETILAPNAQFLTVIPDDTDSVRIPIKRISNE